MKVEAEVRVAQLLALAFLPGISGCHAGEEDTRKDQRKGSGDALILDNLVSGIETTHFCHFQLLSLW